MFSNYKIENNLRCGFPQYVFFVALPNSLIEFASSVKRFTGVMSEAHYMLLNWNAISEEHQIHD
jgi:hypothetical protein